MNESYYWDGASREKSTSVIRQEGESRYTYKCVMSRIQKGVVSHVRVLTIKGMQLGYMCACERASVHACVCAQACVFVCACVRARARVAHHILRSWTSQGCLRAVCVCVVVGWCGLNQYICVLLIVRLNICVHVGVHKCVHEIWHFHDSNNLIISFHMCTDVYMHICIYTCAPTQCHANTNLHIRLHTNTHSF